MERRFSMMDSELNELKKRKRRRILKIGLLISAVSIFIISVTILTIISCFTP